MGDSVEVNWWRQKGSYFGPTTTSTLTGPISDNTVDNNYGHYMLFWTGDLISNGASAIVRNMCRSIQIL